ncbi:MAG: MBL fold metallo-hydrolase [Candidatus Pacebacteria bacterium]|nr:MBL fold metallo-hydrolase [Candidatus Paceibacterota bacterium]
MKIYKIKKLYLLLFLVMFVFFISELILSRDKLVFFSVGQGDSMLVSVHSKNFLIDGGPDWQVITALDRNLPFLNRKLEAIVLSHAHHDHFIGLAEVVRRYKVKKLYFYHHNFSDLAYSSFILSLQDLEVDLINISDQSNLKIANNCEFNWLWPRRGFVSSDLNELSVVLKLKCRNLKVLFTGDISEAVEKLLITSNKDLLVDILKASHHGSKYSNSLVFLKKVQPQIIVFTAGKANKYGLPNPETISRAKKLNIKIKSTSGKKDLIFYIK